MAVERVTLGRTGLEVGVAGLGCGGYSRLGRSYGHTRAESIAVVHAALDAGVTLIDTAASYGTEEIVGAALNDRREAAVISTKHGVTGRDGAFLTGPELIAAVEGNLGRLGTDYIDIFHLHRVAPEEYDYCAAELVPALTRLQEQGKIRFLGLTERFITDTRHAMLARALDDPFWDVVMVGFNLLNPSARHRVFPKAQARGTSTLIMFAVRRALCDQDTASEAVRALVKEGLVSSDAVTLEAPFDFLEAQGVAESLVEAAYRFARHEAGADVVLTGTGSVDHLRENLASLSKPPLSQFVMARLEAVFGGIDSVSGN